MNVHEVLFSDSRAKILALILLNPKKRYYLRQITRLIGKGHGAVQRELERLAQANLVTTERQGNRVYYQANQACLVFQPLRDLVSFTVGPAGQIAKALAPVKDSIDVAFIYGSNATYSTTEASDIDVIIIGHLDYDDAMSRMTRLQDVLNCEINPAIFDPKDFQSRCKDPFIKNVLKNPKLFVVGGEDELRELVQSRLVA